MNREEAIHNLQDLWNEVYNEDSDGYTYAVAIDMAISALQGGDAEMSPQTIHMQQSPNNGADLISRADAIEAVCNAQCELDVPHYPQCDQVKYCDEIKALMALPSAETHELRTETHGVCLISKDDAMGAVQDHFNADGFKGYDDGQKMMDRIKALPSADRLQGEWIEFVSQVDGRFKECNQCGERIYLSTFYENDYNFCPNCGADMRGETR